MRTASKVAVKVAVDHWLIGETEIHLGDFEKLMVLSPNSKCLQIQNEFNLIRHLPTLGSTLYISFILTQIHREFPGAFLDKMLLKDLIQIKILRVPLLLEQPQFSLICHNNIMGKLDMRPVCQATATPDQLSWAEI